MTRRICYNALFLQNHLGGIGNYAYYLIKHIRALHPEWRISLLVHAGTAANFRDLEGVEILSVPLRSRIAKLLYFHLIFPFKVRRFDLLHSVGNMGMAFCPIPQIISIMDCYEKVSPERFGWTKRVLMSMLILHSGRMARRILAISENTKRDVERFYPALKGKVDVVYLGNKFPVVRGAPPADRQNFIFVGTLEPGKNLDLVIKAFARLRVESGCKLIVVGAKGWRQSHISALVDSLGLGASIVFKGYVSDAELQELYGNSLALIQASRYEGFGLPVIEAMACGCPVIAARNSALIEAGGDAALFFEDDDLEGLVKHMETISLNPHVVSDSVEKGRIHVERFTWEKTAIETALVYEFGHEINS